MADGRIEFLAQSEPGIQMNELGTHLTDHKGIGKQVVPPFTNNAVTHAGKVILPDLSTRMANETEFCPTHLIEGIPAASKSHDAH